MEKFKGTKGKWSIREINKFSRWINIEGENGKKLCEATCYTPESSPSRDEAEFNALLISKAPEMLEMLIEISKTAEKIWEIEQDSPFFDEIDFAKLDDLIKEATEI